MLAIVADSGRLTWQAVPDVTPGPGEVLLRVAAAGVNRADLLQAAGNYPPPPGASDIIGLEVSGVIESLGADLDLSLGVVNLTDEAPPLAQFALGYDPVVADPRGAKLFADADRAGFILNEERSFLTKV